MSNQQRSSNQQRPPNPGRGQGGGPQPGKGQQQSGQRGGPPSGGRPQQPRRDGDRGQAPQRPPAPAAPDLEYVLMTARGSIAAEVRNTPLPMRWTAIETPRLFTPGLFLRRGGAMQRISPDLKFEALSAFVLWDDPDRALVRGPREIRTPHIVGLLVPGPKDGPPFIPLHAVFRPDAADHETGLLSPSLDHLTARRMRVTLDIDRGELVVTSYQLVDGDGDAPLLATLRWLADHASDDSAAAELARRGLVEAGHGVQRLGVLLTQRSQDERRQVLEQVLPMLAPEAAPLLSSLWQVFNPATTDERSAEQRVHALCAAASDAIARDSALQSPRGVATLLTWVLGLFGFRPDRDGAQPARALWAAALSAREVSRHLDALGHVDARLPRLPFDRATNSSLLRDAVAQREPDATPVETALRALAIAEWGIEIARPRLVTLWPFALLYPGVAVFPIAARTLVGRYAGVLTGWSLRGAELAMGRLDAGQLGEVIVADMPDPAVSRSLGRALGRMGAHGGMLADVLRASGHPIAAAIADNAGASEVELTGRLHEAAVDKKYTARRLHTAIALIDQVTARIEAGATVDAGWLPQPEKPSPLTVRGQFMYWRAFCRANAGAVGGEQLRFVDTAMAWLPTLPVRHALEATAMIRGLARQDEGCRGRLGAHTDVLVAVLSGALAEVGDSFALERVHNIMAILADTAPDAFVAQLDAILRRDDFIAWEPHRLLEFARRGATGATLVASPAFGRAHQLAADASGAGGGALRAEWLRSALDGARRKNDVRWLTDPRTMHGLLQAPRFVAWFHERGRTLLEGPDAGLVELLEQAIRLVDDSDIDRLVATLHRATRWPDDEQLRLLLTAGQYGGAARHMLRTATGDAASAAQAIAALTGGTTSATSSDLLLAAALHAASLRRGVALPASTTAALTAALARYTPNRYVLDGLARVTDAARLLQLDPHAEPMRRLFEKAAAWAVETAHPGLLRAVRYAGESAVAALAVGAASELPAMIVRLDAEAEKPPHGRRVARVATTELATDVAVSRLAAASIAWLAEDPARVPSDVLRYIDLRQHALRNAAAVEPAAGAEAVEGAATATPEPTGPLAAFTKVARKALERWRGLASAAVNAEIDLTVLAAHLTAFAPRTLDVRDDVASVVAMAVSAKGYELDDRDRLLFADAFDVGHVSLDIDDLRLVVQLALAYALASNRNHIALEKNRITVLLDPAKLAMPTEATPTEANAEATEPAVDATASGTEASGTEASGTEASGTEAAPSDDDRANDDDAAAATEASDDNGDDNGDDSDDDSSDDASDDDAGADAQPAGPDEAADSASAEPAARPPRERRKREPRNNKPRGAEGTASGSVQRKLAALTEALRTGTPTAEAVELGGAEQIALLRHVIGRNSDLKLEFRAVGRVPAAIVTWRQGR